MPDPLQIIPNHIESPRERDMVLLGSLVSLSACLNKINGRYDDKKVYANLYLFIIAPASAGKGSLNNCKCIVLPVHNQLLEEVQFASRRRMLFLPANSSSTGIFQLLNKNNGDELIFETEGDTLTNFFKSEHGDYSDGFRKAFHHETISYFRRTKNEWVEIQNPRLSTVLTGTPNQIFNLIPNTEDGLFSRFIFYGFNITPEWGNLAQAPLGGLLAIAREIGYALRS